MNEIPALSVMDTADLDYLSAAAAELVEQLEKISEHARTLAAAAGYFTMSGGGAM